MASWLQVPVLSGVTYSWITPRNEITDFYSGRIYVPEGITVPCVSCMVPHENSGIVFCYDPWSASRTPLICSECHDALILSGTVEPG